MLQRTVAQAIMEAVGAADARAAHPSNAQRDSLACGDDASAHVLGEAAQTVLAAAAGATAARRAVRLAREALARGRLACGAATLRLLLAMLDVPAVCQARAPAEELGIHRAACSTPLPSIARLTVIALARNA